MPVAPSMSVLRVQGVDRAPCHSVPVFLNHCYAVVSKETYDAFVKSPWLASVFSTVEERTTVSGNRTWTGFYPYFRNTYFELFPEGPIGTVGTAGIGLGDEVAGGVDKVAKALRKELGEENVELSDVSRTIDGKVVPWFRSADFGKALPGVYAWVMQYVPAPGSKRPLTRAENLSKKFDASKLAADIDCVTFRVGEEDQRVLKIALAALGWRISVQGTRLIASSPSDAGVRRRLVFDRAAPNDPGPLGVQRVDFQLNRKVPHHTEVLGDARLEVGIGRGRGESSGGSARASLWLAPSTPAP